MVYARRPTARSEEPQPLGVRAGTVAFEQHVRAICPRHVLLRFGWLLDDSANGLLGASWFVLAEDSPLLLADDRRGNPTPVDDAARVIIAVLKQLIAKRPLWGITTPWGMRRRHRWRSGRRCSARRATSVAISSKS